MSLTITKTSYSFLVPSNSFKDVKFKSKKEISSINNTNVRYKNNNIENKANQETRAFNINHAMNYIYLGSTDMSIVSNMGVTLDDDGSLLFIKGKSRDLFKGLYYKYIKEFKYKGFKVHQENEGNEEKKFDSLFIDDSGTLVGKVKGESNYLKIDINRGREIYSRNSINTKEEDKRIRIIINYDNYNVNGENLTNNIVQVNRDGKDIQIKLSEGKLFVSGLDEITAPVVDVVDGSSQPEYEIRLPAYKNINIKSISKAGSLVKLTVEKNNKIKNYYLNPLYIQSEKEHQYKVSYLLYKPSQNIYSSLGTDGYEKYYSGQPFHSQHIGNFSSKNIPFISSILNDYRVRRAKIKHDVAIGEYKSASIQALKVVDPGLKGILKNLKSIFLSKASPSDNKEKNINHLNKSMNTFMETFNRVVRGINNGKTQADVCLSVINKLKPEESIIINDINDSGLFFSAKILQISTFSSLSIGLMAGYSKTHTLILSKDKENKIVFSFINKANLSASIGVTAGFGGFSQSSAQNDIAYSASGPLMATLLLSSEINKKSNFSFSLNEEEFKLFINGYQNKKIAVSGDVERENIDPIINKIIESATLEYERKFGLSLDLDIRSEIKATLDISVNENTNLSAPRGAVGANIRLNFFKFTSLLNRIIGSGSITVTTETNKQLFEFLSFFSSFYRDLKLTPLPKHEDLSSQLYYPFGTLIDFKNFLKTETDNLLGFRIEDLKYSDDKTVNKKMKSTYRLLSKIDKLRSKYPIEYIMNSEIDKIDSIYLTLNNKIKKDNKISYHKEKNEDDQHSDFIQSFFHSIHKNSKILSRQNRDNMNKRSISYFISKYELKTEIKEECEKIQNEINEKIKQLRENPKNMLIKLDDINKELNQIYHKYKQLTPKIEYQLKTINLMTTGEVEYSDRIIPTGAIRLGNKKKFTQDKLMGKIMFNYQGESTNLNTIETEYYFI
ncbi:TPA: hypothetical protein ACKRFJ_000931 [Proteus mirabilis]|nr:hypothetical protein [Proteus mirabilis]HEJ9660257.1 hypothetical protein [Proteus mirabilis]